jgi:excisionase family DNA binding protein
MFPSISDGRRTVETLATSIKGAAKALSLGRTSIYGLIREGRLETVKLGRRTLIKTASIRALLSDGDVPDAR